MTALTIQEVSRRSGLSEPTLRYYEEVGLVGPIDPDHLYDVAVVGAGPAGLATAVC